MLVDVVLDQTETLFLLTLAELLDLFFLLSDRLHFEACPLVVRDFLGQDADQVLNLVGLLPKLLFLSADVLVLGAELIIRVLGVLQQSLLVVHIFYKGLLSALEVVLRS